jgi:pimeloyl-ACP methyl ester carboxylesterase
MTTFVLVHGAGDGAWIWDKVIPEVEARGHRPVAMDLPCDDITATIEDDVDAIEHAIPPDAGDDVVAVAHATGGLHLAFLGQRRALRHAVYVCALVPTAGKTFVDVMAQESDMYVENGLTATYQVDDLGRSVFSEEQLIADFAIDCPLQEAKHYATLSRPQKLTTFMEILPPPPAVPSTYVIGRRDITLNPEWSRRVARERLHADVVELDAGHTPMLGAARLLADVLAAVVS